jgi:hypothetical protein
MPSPPRNCLLTRKSTLHKVGDYATIYKSNAFYGLRMVFKLFLHILAGQKEFLQPKGRIT